MNIMSQMHKYNVHNSSLMYTCSLIPYPPPDYTSHPHPLPTSRLYISPSPPTHLQTIHLTLTPYPPPDYTSHPRPLPTSRLYISLSPPTHLQTIHLTLIPTHLQTIHLTLIPYPPPDYTSHPYPLPQTIYAPSSECSIGFESIHCIRGKRQN